jgi:hypothetical protein
VAENFKVIHGSEIESICATARACSFVKEFDNWQPAKFSVALLNALRGVFMVINSPNNIHFSGVIIDRKTPVTAFVRPHFARSISIHQTADIPR